VDDLDFDVFCCHNSLDKDQIELIAAKLKRRKIKSWIDKQQIFGGQSFQTEIQKVIPKIKSAAIFFGNNGLGDWQEKEIQVLLDECDKSKKPFIPILLPGIKEVPPELRFIKQKHWISFEEINNQALDDLESSIKCQRVSPFFDTILCYEDRDICEIQEIENQLKVAGVNLWKSGISPLHLHTMYRELEVSRTRIYSMVIFVGNNGGPWESELIYDIMVYFRMQKCIVIPVILSSLVQTQEPDLPIPIATSGKVDFRKQEPEPLQRLLQGIMG
jgi:hypothetical protein